MSTGNFRRRSLFCVIRRNGYERVTPRSNESAQADGMYQGMLMLLALAAAPSDGHLKLKTDRVVVFKDGYALFVKTAEGVADDRGRVYTNEVPEGAILGSFWAFADGKPSLTMRAEWVDHFDRKSTKSSALTLGELVRANVGKRVTLRFVDTTRAELSGTLVLSPQGGDLLVIENEQGRTALSVTEVRSISGPSLSTDVERKEDTATREKQLTFELGSGARNEPVKISMLYFTEGVRWIPTYRLSGDLETKGQLVLQGEVINEAEPIVDAQLDLVVGVPNFKMKDTPSPLTLERALRGALANAAPQFLGNQNLSNAMFNYVDPNASADRVAGAGKSMAEADAAQDLFVYHATRTSIAKGARLALPLFAEEVAIRHLFTFDVSAETPLTENRVWHQLELENKSGSPWTTGPVLMMRNGVPLAQEILKFTTKGGCARVPVTIAPDVRAMKKVVELDRAPSALTWNHQLFAKIKKKVTVTVKNQRDKKVVLSVAIDAVGRAEGANAGGKVELETLDGPNPKSTARWELELAPGQSRELSVDVTTFVP